MKNLLRLGALLAFLCAAANLPAERFDAAAWSKVQVVEISSLQKLDRLPVGQVIGIKFNYRHQRIRHLKPNWYQGSLWSNAPVGKKKFLFVQVMVPKAALAAFKALPTDFQSAEEHVAYGQLQQDAEANKFRFIRLFGTKVAKDATGIVTVSW